ncbi:MAG: GNAT family N-acetyltransferase [Elusimicrobiota bacterium]
MAPAPQLAAPAAPSIALLAPVPSAVPAAPLTTATNGYHLIERTGRNSFGHAVLVLDLLDPRDPSAGTIAHIDLSYNGDQAQLDGPLDSFVGPSASGVPEGADLTHFRRYLWFGLAVKPDHQGLGLGVRLIDEAVARLRAAGIQTLYVRATEASHGFYMRRFVGRVRDVEPETDTDGDKLYRLEIDLR